MGKKFGEAAATKGDGLAFKDHFDARAAPRRAASVVGVDAAADRFLDRVFGRRLPLLLTPKAQAKLDATVQPLGEPVGRTATIAQHLKKGREISDEKDRKHRAWCQWVADRRQEHWNNLMHAATGVLGVELAAKCPPDPPVSFGVDTELFKVVVTPFGRSHFEVEFECVLRKLEHGRREYARPWQLRRTGPENKPFEVAQDWRPSSDGERPTKTCRCETVSEAVHLCYLQGGGWEEARAKTGQMKARDVEEMSKR